jgi:hypothetical protein
VLSIKAKKKWLKAIDRHLQDVSRSLFGQGFLICGHEADVTITSDKTITICFRVNAGNPLSYFDDDFIIFLRTGGCQVRLSVPFWWKVLLKRRVKKLMKTSLINEIERLRGELVWITTLRLQP